MHDINLIPDNILFRKQKIASLVLKIFLAVLILALITVASVWIVYEKHRIENQIEEISAVIDLHSLNDISDLEKQLAIKTAEKERLDRVLMNIPQRTIVFTEVLKRVMAQMPESFNTTYIDYDSESKTIALDLEAGSRKDISLFLKQLYDDALYQEVSISSIMGVNPPFSFTVRIELGDDNIG